MRKKIATTIDAELYERAKQRSRLEGRPFNALLEEALINYLDSTGRQRSVVKESAGVLPVPFHVVREVIEVDLYDAE